MSIKKEKSNEKLKINFNKIFFQPFNWTNKNAKIAEIDSKKENNKRSFTNNIFESFAYLNELYNKISFDENIDIIDFVISSIIFNSLIEKIQDIDTKFSSNILNKCNFSKIINNNFLLRNENYELYAPNYNIDKIFIETYIGGNNFDKEKYELLFLKGIRNKLIHPNGKMYNKTHMYSIGTYNESKSKNFSFGECSFVESIEHTSPTFFIKKTIFLEVIKEISEKFSKKISKSFDLYIKADAERKNPSLELCSIKESNNKYKEYFEDWEDIYFLFIWSKEKPENKNLIEYLRIIYTITKFMKKSNNIDYFQEQFIKLNIDEDIEKIMVECGHKNDNNNLLRKMDEENLPENEWFYFFGKKQSDIFRKKYNESEIKSHHLENIREKFLIIILNSKTQQDFLLLLDNLKLEYEKLKEQFKHKNIDFI